MRRSCAASPALRISRLGTTGRLSHHATSGEASHAARNGSANGNALARSGSTPSSTPRAAAGPAHISATNTRGPRRASSPAARAAVAAAVSHSSSRRCVITIRTRVRTMACTIS